MKYISIFLLLYQRRRDTYHNDTHHNDAQPNENLTQWHSA